MSWQDVADMFAGMCEQVSEWSSCDDCPMFAKVDDFADCRLAFARMVRGNIGKLWAAEIDEIAGKTFCGMCGLPVSGSVCHECGAVALSGGRFWFGTDTEPAKAKTEPQKALQR